MASIRSVFSNGRFRLFAYARHETGRGVVRVEVTHAPSYVIRGILKRDNPTALKIMRNYSAEGKGIIAGTQRANMLEVFKENYILTPEEEAEVQAIIDTMTVEDMDRWAHENREIVRTFWEHYETRRYETFMGPTEAEKDSMYKELIGSLKGQRR